MSMDLTLDRIRATASALPPYTRPTCHIAGTNGKGSVAALLSVIFLAAGLSVGRFTSPHLVYVRDSIVLNGEPVDEELYSAAQAAVQAAHGGSELSSFELLTLTALRVFEDAKVDVAVVEVGMGGLRDATNVLPDAAILVSALASVALDHQAHLGPDVAAIAREKAGIARRGLPFALGPQVHDEVAGIVREVVSDVGGEVLHVDAAVPREWDAKVDGVEPAHICLDPDDFRPPAPRPVSVSVASSKEPLDLSLPLHGDHQLDNLGLVAGVLSAIRAHPHCKNVLPPSVREKITDAAIKQGARSTTWPGRLSFHTVSVPVPDALSKCVVVLADGAHNPASAHSLADYLSFLVSPSASALPAKRTITFILALSHSPPKTPLQTLAPLFAAFAHPYEQTRVRAALVPFSTPVEGMPWVCCVPPSEVMEVVSALAPNAEVVQREGLGDALRWAVSDEKRGEGLVVVAGSLYLVADFYRWVDENEGVLS